MKHAIRTTFLCIILSGGLLVAGAESVAGQPQSDDVKSEAQLIWSKILTKCGADYFKKDLYTVSGSPSYYPKAEDFTQFRGVAFTIHGASGSQLSEADRMNGVQWDGEIIMKSRLYRKTWESPTWHEWSDGTQQEAFSYIAISLKKQNGVWTTYDLNTGTKAVSDMPDAAPQCDEIPPN